MAQQNINVTADAIEALRRMSATLYGLNEELLAQLHKLRNHFEENAPGLGAHTEEIQLLLEQLEELSAQTVKSNEKLAKKVSRAAVIRQGLLEGSPYRQEDTADDRTYLPHALGDVYDELARHGIHPSHLGPGKETPVASVRKTGHPSPYVKTVYTSSVRYTDPVTKQRKEKISHREVYENTAIDPNAVIPAGTKYVNGQCVKADITNLDLMKSGKAPFISGTDEDGNPCWIPVELHHLTGEETRRGSQYFTGTQQDGSLVELANTKHKQYNKQLHIAGSSFRKNPDGTKSEDKAKYDNYRSAYWKHRAEKYLQGE